MKIGITERGDAGLDLSWFDKLGSVDGAVIITKNLTSNNFKSKVLSVKEHIILHCTCTGYGGSIVEPNVPVYKEQLDSLKQLIDDGFPSSHVVLRIDPIFPSIKGLRRVKAVLDYFSSLNLGIRIIRISLIDEYSHVKERYRQLGIRPLYKGFSPSKEQVALVAKFLSQYNFDFETCAEDYLCSLMPNANIIGCISKKDLKILGIKEEDLSINPQHRTGCHCLSCKTELLTNKKQCPHKCIYCYWR